MSMIFVSYRRDDSADTTGRIEDKLVHKFGKQKVFNDLSSIGMGDFREKIHTALAKARIILVVMGPTWLDISDGHQRRLDNPADFVRIEVETALGKAERREAVVVPLYVNGMQPPSPQSLPQAIHRLAYQNGFHLRPEPDFSKDFDGLMKALRFELSWLTRFRRFLAGLFFSRRQIKLDHAEVKPAEPPRQHAGIDEMIQDAVEQFFLHLTNGRIDQASQLLVPEDRARGRAADLAAIQVVKFTVLKVRVSGGEAEAQVQVQTPGGQASFESVFLRRGTSGEWLVHLSHASKYRTVSDEEMMQILHSAGSSSAPSTIKECRYCRWSGEVPNATLRCPDCERKGLFKRKRR